jgi:hypothetical protein
VVDLELISSAAVLAAPAVAFENLQLQFSISLRRQANSTFLN